MLNYGRLYRTPNDGRELNGRLGGNYGLFGAIAANKSFSGKFSTDPLDDDDEDASDNGTHVYIHDEKTKKVIASMSVDTFSGNCGNMLVWGLSRFRQTATYEQLYEMIELFAKETFHGMALYGVDIQNQQVYIEAMEKRGWKKLYEFKSPRTRNTCAMYGKDLTV